MPLKVKACVQYLTEKVDKMRESDFITLQITKAVKGRDPGGRSRELTYNHKAYTFGPSDPSGAVDLWTDWAANILKRTREKIGRRICLVPVPNSKAVVGETESFRTLELAQIIADKIGQDVEAKDELRWTEVMTPANQGGDRYAYTLYPKLSFHQRGNQDVTRFLIDDVLTSGGHLQACAACLKVNDFDPCAAIVCGRTEHVQITNPFRVPMVELDDFDPDDPHGFDDLAEIMRRRGFEL